MQQQTHSTSEQNSSHHHDHEHRLFGAYGELIFSILAGLFLAIGFILSLTFHNSDTISLAFYLGAYFFGGFFTAKEAWESLRNKHFEIDFLMLLAAIGAGFLGEWAEGALLLFLFSLGHALEHYAMNKARKSIATLTVLHPKRRLSEGVINSLRCPLRI